MSKATDTHYEYVLLLLHANNCCKKAPQCYVTLTWFYLLTPRCRVLFEKLTGLQLVKKFPAFHGTRRFITALTSVRHLSLSRASPVQSIYPHPTSWRSILILSTHLRLGLPSGFTRDIKCSGLENATVRYCWIIRAYRCRSVGGSIHCFLLHSVHPKGMKKINYLYRMR